MEVDMSTTCDIVVMGDINLDWSCKNLLSFAFSELVINGVIEWLPIAELPGGSGINFARFAQEIGYRPVLLGKIGDDPAGRFIYGWLQERGLEAGISVDTSLSTGKAFIVRDKDDIRFLVNNTPNANRALSASDTEQYADLLSSSKVLYISGYCLMDREAPRREATLTAMRLAHEGDHTHIVFDVVPHQFYKIYSFQEFQELTSEVDILISEVATMRRFLEMGDRQEEITRSLAQDTAEHLVELRLYDQFILRFGPSGCDEQVIWDTRTADLVWEETGHEDARDKRGYGDRLTLRVLKDLFRIEPSVQDG
jgi:sugar/nucleoside kinase (ribokinase family)